MPIEFRCTSCGKLLRTGDGTAGRQAKCPQCGAVVMVPAAPTTSPGADATAGWPGSAESTAPREPVNPFQSPQAPAMAAPETIDRGPIQPGMLDVGDVFGRTWDIFKSQLGMCLAVVLVAWLLPVGVSWVINMFAQVAGVVSRTPAIPPLVQVVTMIPLQLFTLYLYWGMIRMLLKIARGQRFEFGELFAYRPQFWPFLGVVLLLGLAYAAVAMVIAVPTSIVVFGISRPAGPEAMMGAVIIAIAVTCLIATIPWVIIWLFFGQAPFLVLDREVPVLESFGLSKNLMVGNKGTLFLIWLLEIAVAILGFCACCAGLLFAVPFLRLLNVVTYMTLIGDKGITMQSGDQGITMQSGDQGVWDAGHAPGSAAGLSSGA